MLAVGTEVLVFRRSVCFVLDVPLVLVCRQLSELEGAVDLCRAFRHHERVNPGRSYSTFPTAGHPVATTLCAQTWFQ